MRSAWSVYGLLAAASVVYGLCLFDGLDQWGRGDWDQFSFRYETPRRALLRDGQLPAWNPYVNGGNVLLAHPHCPALSPWYLPTLLLGAPLALRVQVLLFVILGTTGMAALLRRWGVSPAGCFAGGVMLMMSAHFTMHVTEGHLEWCLLGLMPWVMWCLVRAEHDRRFVILAALVLASALLHGSIYIVVIFTPLLAVWAGLESVRTRSWRAAAGCAVMVALTCLLCTVVLIPRLEFLHANPRDTQRHEQIAPAKIPQMLLDPRQADLFRSTRDVRNPPDDQLARLLPGQLWMLTRKHASGWWHRLDLTVETDSDWSELRFEGFDYIMIPGQPEAKDRPARILDLTPLSREGIAFEESTAGKTRTQRATLYARLPKQGGMRMVILRGNAGATSLKITCNGVLLLDVIHAKTVPGDPGNHLQLEIPRDRVLGLDRPVADAPWYRLEVTLATDSDWCNVRVVDSPYLFHVEQPEIERRAPVPLSTTPMIIDRRPPEEKGTKTQRRAILYVQATDEDGLCLEITQGTVGSSKLTLKTVEGEDLAPVEEIDWDLHEGDLHEEDLHEEEGKKTVAGEDQEPAEENGRDPLAEREKTYRYRLSGEALQGLEVPTPARWRLDQWGMTYDWHEYGIYATWIGFALAVGGLIVSFRRHWPLMVTAAIAGLISLGATLPLNLWAVWQLLPMYGSLQVPSRFLVVVVFAMAACGGLGLERLGRWVEAKAGVWPRRVLGWGLATAIYIELAVLGWNLFGDIFVCPPRPVPKHATTHFAQRYRADDVRYAAMYSAHYPYLLDNSGVLREYENIAVKRGKIRLERLADGQTVNPEYRGEAWLEGRHGTATIGPDGWTMSRVKVALEVDAADRLVLNGNYFSGWKAIRRDAAGKSEALTAEPTEDGLVSIPVRPGDREVEFYYRPNGFFLGAVISGLTLMGCLVVLVGMGSRKWQSGRFTRFVVRTARRCESAFEITAVRYVACAAALNVPFLLCHPGWTLVGAPLVRALAIGSVLFLAPGLPLVGAMIGRGWLPRFSLLWTMAASLAVFLAVLVTVNLAGLPLGGSVMWNGTWILTNLALLLSGCLGGPPAWGIRPGKEDWRLGVPLFAAAYLIFYAGATQVVPPMEDHDLEIQAPAYALLTRFEPEAVNDRGLLYHFAHPLLLNYYAGGSFLYHNQLDYLERFDKATRRIRQAESRAGIEPEGKEFLREFLRFSEHHLGRDRGVDKPGMTRHRIVDVRNGNYVFDPPLPQWEGRAQKGEPPVRQQVKELPAREFEVKILSDDYQHDPRRLETRTPNIFLAALTVALLGGWIVRRTGLWWLALLVPAAYATGPEVFVRSSYGGYFAVSMFALMQILLAVERSSCDRSRAARAACLLAGAFAALVNHKLVLLPAALVVWQFFRSDEGTVGRRLVRAVAQPAVLGFAAATLAFCIYGLAVDREAFWADFMRSHLLDRIAHLDRLGYSGYPSVAQLWWEFWQHTGYLLLPLGLVAVEMLCRMKRPINGSGCLVDSAGPEDVTIGSRGMPGLWAVWITLTAVAFSLIDWRQTKHLMPLLLPLHLAPALWAASGRAARLAVGVLLAVLLLWNLATLRELVVEFDAFSITPAW